MFSFFKRFKGSKTAETPSDVPAAAQEPAFDPATATTTPSATPLSSEVVTATPELQPKLSPELPPTAQPEQVAPVSPPPHAAPPSVTTEATTVTTEVSPPAPVIQPVAQPVTPAPAASPAPALSTASVPLTATAAAAPAPAHAPAEATASAADEIIEIVPPPPVEPAARKSWLTRLKTGLSKTSSNLTGIFVRTKIDEDLYEELETALLMSDAGVEATEFLLKALREKVRAERLTDPQQVKAALRTLLVELLKPLEKSLMLGHAQPLVMMIAGVNGAGKTTSIGKLAKHLQRFDQSVLLAAGDTFRAAAREQLAIWGARNNVTVVAQESADAAAVIFDAVGAARARKIDVLMADTAGRLPTQLHLMEELRKVKRVIGKALDGAPHEVLLVIDANTGQNALAQVKSFDDALGLTGLIVTKLDGTAKGGILAAIARQRPVPVYFIGVGESVEDLQPFSAEEFSDALLGG
ncbi:signal recognition particle-docking protein FtsY [Paraburkholderia bonniea]|uniref:signal recognition particle-docking protein FtsY n=1 Tax=Paraburkholderia bonniea TaxID=2152891 RepID=UPI002573B751|nr:signal recognition particle-docking protein FtsY [Paraburkholderia bonniea]WJF89962.1 signal recognition particle-docking protein FtsY [Paraburkholderia bonniea]WJF93276.1 signal recognition particle-docking protein FtsY [Paraburkholderia bonniea]